MDEFPYVQSTFKQGVILGFGFCCYTILMWLTKLDTTYLSIGQYFDMGIILLPIGIIFWAIGQEIKSYDLSIWDRIGIAIFVSFISYVIYDPFLYIYHNIINPTWYFSVIQHKTNDMLLTGKTTAEIALEMERTKSSLVAQSGLFRLSTFIPSVVVLPIVIVFLSLFFVRKITT